MSTVIQPAKGTHTLDEIDRYLDMVPEHERKKYGGTYVSSDYKLYFFATEGDAEAFADSGDGSLVLAGPFPIGGGGGGSTDSVQFRFVSYPTSIYVTNSNEQNVAINVRSVEIIDGVEQPFDYAVNLQIIVKKDSQNITYDVGSIETNKSVSVDILQGNNKFRISDGCSVQFVATSSTGQSVRTTDIAVKMTTMILEIASDSFWHTPYVYGIDTWKIPLRLSTNVPSRLVATLTDAEGVVRSTSQIPNDAFTSNYDLSLQHPIANGGSSGIYTLAIQLVPNDSSLSHLAISHEFNVACVDSSDTNSYLLVNNIGSITNYATSRVFDYVVISGYGNPTVRFEVRVDGKAVADTGALNIVSGQKYSYNLSLQVVSDSDFDVDIIGYIEDAEVSEYSFIATNKAGYAPTSGASTFISMAGRSNLESNPQIFYNSINGGAILPTLYNVNFSATDGYQSELLDDGTQRTFFRLQSGSQMVLPLKVLAMSTNQARTFEIDYRLVNVLDRQGVIIDCSREADGSFYGMRITAETATIRAASARVDDDQTAGLSADDEMRLTVVVRPQPQGSATNIDNFSCIFIYINGCLCKEFEYGKDLNVDAFLTIGGEASGIDIFAIRVYDNTALTREEVEKNTANLLPTERERNEYQQRNDVRQYNAVDYAKVASRCNTIIFDTPTLPSRDWASDASAVAATIEFYKKGQATPEYVHTPTNFFWQGTTSHNYGTSYNGANIGQNYKWSFGGRKYCAKANWASSMQSHKIALTMLYTELARECGVIDVNRRLSIQQQPAAGFWRNSVGNLVFIGLFTVGEDKGDKDTFGFNTNSIALENSDNEPVGSNFLCPWNDDTVSTPDKEKYYIMGQKAWEDSMKNDDLVERRWKPFFNLVFSCSQKIKPYDGDFAALQADTSILVLDEDGNPVDTKDGCCRWVNDGKVYYFHIVVKEWKDSGVSVNLEGKTGTLDEINEQIKQERVDYFRSNIGYVANIDNAIYHICFIEFFACTDNLSKNTYPFILDCNSADSLIEWRQDDLDSAIMTENQGKNYKKYCVEIGDNYDEYGRNSLQVFNGTENQFWLLLRKAFATQIEDFMRDRFIAKLTADSVAPVVSFAALCKRYFFDNAQLHFPEALYNETSKIRYEAASLDTSYNYQGLALSQNSGNAYYMEKEWLSMRFVYMCSKYLAQMFKGGYTGDTFTTRPYSGDNPNTYIITPAIYMYPSIQNGQNAMRGSRIYPGSDNTSHTFTLPISQGDQEQRISGMSYIRSVGEMYNLSIQANVNMNGQMLTDIELGSVFHTGFANHITGLSVGNASSLRRVDLANITTLGGAVNFEQCLNLRELYAENTNVTSITLCDGGMLNTLHLPDTITTLELKNKAVLTDFEVGGFSNLRVVSVEGCSATVMREVLSNIADARQLERVNLVFGPTSSKATPLTKEQILNIVNIIEDASITNKTFGGYIRLTGDSINKAQRYALQAKGITYIGEADDVDFEAGIDRSDYIEGETVIVVTDVPASAIKVEVVSVNGIVGEVTESDVKGLFTVVGNEIRMAQLGRGSEWKATVNIKVSSAFSAKILNLSFTVTGVLPISAVSITGDDTISVIDDETKRTRYRISCTPTNYNEPVTSLNVASNNKDVTIENTTINGFDVVVTTDKDIEATITVIVNGKMASKIISIVHLIVPDVEIVCDEPIVYDESGVIHCRFVYTPSNYNVNVEPRLVDAGSYAVSELTKDGFAISLDGIIADTTVSIVAYFTINRKTVLVTNDIIAVTRKYSRFRVYVESAWVVPSSNKEVKVGNLTATYIGDCLWMVDDDAAQNQEDKTVYVGDVAVGTYGATDIFGDDTRFGREYQSAIVSNNKYGSVFISNNDIMQITKVRSLTGYPVYLSQNNDKPFTSQDYDAYANADDELNGFPFVFDGRKNRFLYAELAANDGTINLQYWYKNTNYVSRPTDFFANGLSQIIARGGSGKAKCTLLSNTGIEWTLKSVVCSNRKFQITEQSNDGFTVVVNGVAEGVDETSSISITYEFNGIEKTITAEVIASYAQDITPFIIHNTTDSPITFSIISQIEEIVAQQAIVDDYHLGESETYDFGGVDMVTIVYKDGATTDITLYGGQSFFIVTPLSLSWGSYSGYNKFSIQNIGLEFDGDILALLKDRKFKPNTYYGGFSYMFKDCLGITKTPALRAVCEQYALYGMFAGCKNLTDASNIIIEKVDSRSCEDMFNGCEKLAVPPRLNATTLSEYCYMSMFNGCSSLEVAPELPATTLALSCYQSMFHSCKGMTVPPELPATTLAVNCYDSMFGYCERLSVIPYLRAEVLQIGCYGYMFIGCKSLKAVGELPATTLDYGCYERMFAECSSLQIAPNLPVKKLAASCYQGMFAFCSSLKDAPELPATSLENGCYESMFANCTNLTIAPKLPATTLAQSCYSDMFKNCNNLVNAPELPAKDLEIACYTRMFENCKRLNSITALFETLPSSDYTRFWMRGVSNTGTFVKSINATWDDVGENAVPVGWTVEYTVNARRQ